MIKNILKWLTVFILGMFGGVLGSQVLWPYFVERPLFLKYRLEQNPAPVIEKKEIFIQEDTAVQESIKKVQGAVVNVKIETKKGEIETTGLISTSDGTLIVISQNIPPDFSQIIVSNSDFSVPATILKKKSNLSLLKIEKDNLPTVSFSEPKEINLGEKVFYLTRLTDKNKKSIDTLVNMVNIGFITKISPAVVYTSMNGEKAEIGSPLFNMKGELLGIIFLDQAGKVEAIPITTIKAFLGI